MNLFYSLTTIVIIAIVINSEISDGYRILGLFPLNGKSHFIISEQLMKTLAGKGHQVDVISHFPLKKPIPNYRDFSLAGSIPDAVNNLTYASVQDFASGSLDSLMEVTGSRICGLFDHPVINNIIKNPPTNPPYDLVIVEVFTAHCYFAFGKHLNVPMIGVATAALYDWMSDPMGNPNNLAIVPGAFSGLPTKMNFLQRVQNVLLSLIVKYQFSYYVEQQKQYVDKHFGPGYPSIDELSRNFSLLLVNSHYSFTGIQPMTPGVIEVGGLHIDDSNEKLIPELQKWLDESKHGCIYVSFGSLVKIESFPKEIIEAFYATFKKIAPVRVLMKIAKKEELLPGLPENVKIHPWLPQIQILKHKNVKAFVSHGGLMSTLESLYFGVPLVGIPLYGDQILNINFCAKNKMALSLNYKNLTEKAFTEAINTVLKDSEFRSNIERISKLYYDRPMNPKDTAVYWVEYVIRHGNVLRSPAIDLAWWQVQLLDVYGFILFIIVFVLFIALFIIRSLLKCVFYSKKADKVLLSKKKK